LARASTLILALTLILGSATTATAVGDFHFIASCAEEMYGNTNMRLHGRLWINNDLYETWSENYGYVNLDLTQIRPATTSDSIVTCVIEAFYSDAGSWYLLGTYFDSYTIPGMGPRGVEIYSDAFIMAEWVWDPAESSMILSGDYRWYCNQCSTDRISASQTVLNTAVDGSDPPEDGKFQRPWTQ